MATVPDQWVTQLCAECDGKFCAECDEIKQKEDNMVVLVLHPFCGPVLADAPSDALYQVDAGQLIGWINDYRSARPMFQSWDSYLNERLEELRPATLPAVLVNKP